MSQSQDHGSTTMARTMTAPAASPAAYQRTRPVWVRLRQHVQDSRLAAPSPVDEVEEVVTVHPRKPE